MISIQNLSKKYGSKTVLDGINISLDKGKVYGIVGKNGAGKTTLFRCLSGLENYDGEVISEYDNLKNHIGILETNPGFMSRITGWEYLKLHCVARNINDDDFKSQNIFELPLDQYADTYSTGMKKKLALFAIILQRNDVYILDEPFNGVDIQSNILIDGIMESLKAKQKTLLIASHIFSTLRSTCDKIFLMSEGRIEAEYTPDQYDDLEAIMKAESMSNNISNLIIQ